MPSNESSSPTRPVAFGEELQRLREIAGISIDDIIAETKISRRILEGLEDGRFQVLPERVFSRNFVRQYARTVGFDENRLVEWFDAAWDRFQLTSGSQPVLVIDEPPPVPPFRWRVWLPVAVGIVIMGLVGAVIVRGRLIGEEMRADPRRSTATRLAPTQFVATVVPSPEPTITEDNDVEETVRLMIRVADDRECWVEYRDRDGRTDRLLLTNGDDLELALRGPILVTLGNAAAVTLSVAGTEYRDLGRAGQVVRAEVSATGLNVLGATSNRS